MEKMDTFDRMVIGMSHAERMCLYDKLCASISSEEQTIQPPVDTQDISSGQDIQTRLKTESSLFRFFLFLRSIFSGVDISKIYNNILLSRLAHRIEKSRPGLLMYKKGMIGGAFYEQVRQLKNVADFFKPAVSLYEEDPGRFYVFLSSLLLADYYAYVEREIDPFLLGDNKEPVPEVKQSLVRRMDEVFQELTIAQRNSLYQSVINIDWLRQFVRLPYEKMLARFLPNSDGNYVAQLELISNDLSHFCKVLCNAKSVTVEILQAMCLFSTNSQLEQQQVDVEALTADYVTKSLAQVAIIKNFLKAIPVKQLACLAFKSANWTPGQPEGAEDWFVKFKGEWRKLLEARWNEWTKSKKKQLVEQKVFNMFKCMKLPELPYQPWNVEWCDIKFTRNKAMGFMYAFFSTLFGDISKLLKILAMDGDFRVRENKIEFVEAFNEYAKLAGDVDAFVRKFSPEGEIGQFFANVAESEDRSVKIHARLESAIQSAYSESTALSMRFTQLTTTIVNVLAGVNSENKVGKYDSINNLSSIAGRFNQRYRQQLVEVHDTLADAVNCLRELESFEN